MHDIHVKGEKEPITVNDDELEIIKAVQQQGLDGVWIGSRYLSRTSIRMIVPGQKPLPSLLLQGGMDMSVPVGMSDEERKRKMKIMMDAYIETRNEIRAERGEGPLTDVEIPSLFRRLVATSG